MNVRMNGRFFTQFELTSYVWPTVIHIAEQTVGSCVIPCNYGLPNLCMEYNLCENTGIETFRITDTTGRHVYVQDFRELPCVKNGPKAVDAVVELLNRAWGIGGNPQSTKQAKTQTAFNQSHSWFVGWMKSWMMKEINRVEKLEPACTPQICDELVRGI